jgi:MFS transporter, FHS family, glucose/mannose:H+ symporter
MTKFLDIFSSSKYKIPAEKNNFFLNLSFFYAMFLFGINFGMVSPILIELSEKIGVPVSVMGNFFSLVAIGFITGALISSLLARFNIRKIVFLSFYFLLPASIFSIAFSNNYNFLLISGFFMGLANGLLESNITVLLSEINKGKEAQYINNSQAVISFGAFIGPLISTFLVKSGISIKTAFVLIALLCFLNFIFILFLDIPSGHFDKKDSFKLSSVSFKNKIKNSNRNTGNVLIRNIFIMLALFAAMFLYVCSESGINSWIPTYLRIEKNFSAVLAGNIISFFWLSVALGRLVTGYFSRKTRSTYILFAITLISVIMFKIGTMLGNPISVAAVFLITGFFVSGLWPMIASLGVEFFPKKGSTFLPLVIMSGGAGSIFSPWLIGVIYSGSNLSRAINIIFIFFILLMAVISFLLFSDLKFFRKKSQT